MADIVEPARRSQMMAHIGARDTLPEVRVRSLLHRAGYRFRLHVSALPGTPDIVLAKYRTIIRVQGCFWHRHDDCRLAYVPKSREEFWRAKFESNVVRDARQRNELEAAGWLVIDVWECETRSPVTLRRVLSERLPKQHTQEWV
jgi:DNA mismatch endonuclease, patch repair protein